MSQACLKQIMYWDKALKSAQKGHRRKNRLIFRLERRVASLETENRELTLRIAELELSE